METLNIKFPSIRENLRLVESFIDNAKEKFHIKDDLYGNIMVAVTESVNNAIIHGNKEDSNKNVSLTLILGDSTIKCVVEDEGDGFDYDSLPDPTAPENLFKMGGRGVFLIKNLSDDVKFENQGRKIIMSFNVEQ
jgi:serine/threonine-protein kinase RsbW